MRLRRPRRRSLGPPTRVKLRVTCGGVVASEAMLNDALTTLFTGDSEVFVMYDAGPPGGRVAVYLLRETGVDE